MVGGHEPIVARKQAAVDDESVEGLAAALRARSSARNSAARADAGSTAGL